MKQKKDTYAWIKGVSWDVVKMLNNVQHLFKNNTCICGDLVNEIKLAQPTISQHLKELKHLGLIKGNVEGTSVCYCINKENWTAMKTVMSQFLDQDLAEMQDCC